MHGLLPWIDPHEMRRVILASLCFVCVASGALIARAGGDALFLSHFGSGPLPWMYIAGAFATGIGTYGCIWASRRLKTGNVAILVGGILFLGNLTLFTLFGVLPSFSRAGAYLLADVSVRIPVFLFWALASEIFDAQQSRRLFGLIGSAGTAACLPAGLLVGPLARVAGAESLVLVSATLMGGFIVFAAALIRDQRAPAKSPRGLATGGAASARSVNATPQLLTIAALAVMTSLVETVVDFQFKTTVANADSADLVHIFGTLYAVCSVISLLLQLVVVHRLLAVAGTLASLSVLPAVLLLAQAGILRFGSSAWVFATKGLDITLSTTINGTARQLLYRGIRRESRLTARALADGLYLPLAIGLAGAGLGIMSESISIQRAAIAAVAGCVIWLVLARVAHSTYVTGLINSLKARQFDSTEETLISRSAVLVAWLRDAFRSTSDEELIYLATLLPQLGRLVQPVPLQSALERDNPGVKVAILQSLPASGIAEGPALARSLSHHTDAEVRRAAILAGSDWSSSLAELEWLEHGLSDREPRVRAVAAASFANAADEEARTIGRDRLNKMISSDDPAFRAAAAEALEHVIDSSASALEFRIPALESLIRDDSVPVALAAIETIRSGRLSALAVPVLSLLARPVLAGAASDALVAMGPAVIDAVLPITEHPNDPQSEAILANVPPVIERIGDTRGLAVIRKMLTPRLPEQRTAVFRCYVQLLGQDGPAGAADETIDAFVDQECRAALARLATVRALGSDPAVQIARDAVSELAASHVLNAFTLLARRVGDVDIMVLHRQITSGTSEERSNALELLENVLAKPSRDSLLAVLEARTETEEADPAAQVMALLSDRDSEWTVAGAAWAAARLALVSCGEQLEALKDHESPVVRETAAFALATLGAAQ